MIDQIVLPFAGFTVVVKRRIDRFIAIEAPIHVDDILVLDIEALCDQGNLVGVQVAPFECGDLALCRAQLEEELLLARGSADLHKRPRTQDVILDRSLDPPHRVGGEAKAPFGLKALQRLHQADITFGDDLRNGKTITAVTHGDLDRETQMTGDELVGGITVAVLAPAFGELIFLVPFEHREAPDVVEIGLPSSISDRRRLTPC